jgi:hypothetical protein
VVAGDRERAGGVLRRIGAALQTHRGPAYLAGPEAQIATVAATLIP